MSYGLSRPGGAGSSWIQFQARGEVTVLMRSGLDQSTAMKVSGPLTDSVFGRCNIVEESVRATALRAADAWLSTRPTTRKAVAAAQRQD